MTEANKSKDGEERRGGVRIPLARQAHFFFPGGDGRAQCENLSPGGMYLAASKLPPKAAPVTVAFDLGAKTKPLAVSGRVVRRVTNGGRSGFAVAFAGDNDAHTLETIGGYVFARDRVVEEIPVVENTEPENPVQRTVAQAAYAALHRDAEALSARLADLERRKKKVTELRESLGQLRVSHETLSCREGDLRDREIEMTEREQELDEQAASIALRETEARRLEQKICVANVGLEAHERELTSREEGVAARENEVDAVERRSRELEERLADLDRRELQLEEKAKLLDAQQETILRQQSHLTRGHEMLLTRWDGLDSPAGDAGTAKDETDDQRQRLVDLEAKMAAAYEEKAAKLNDQFAALSDLEAKVHDERRRLSTRKAALDDRERLLTATVLGGDS